MNAEDRENLLELAQSEGWASVLRFFDSLAGVLEADVLKCDLSSSSDRELVIRKARAEGARRLISTLAADMAKLKNREKVRQTE